MLQLATQAGGLAAFVLALFFVGRAMRADAAKRLDAYTGRLERRIRTLERRLDRADRRRYQLEAILRAAGIPVPPWPHDDVDHDHETHAGQLLDPRRI